MLPFARMLEYGNIVPSVPTISKFKVNYTTKALLYSTGELFTSGSGTNYKLGTGTTDNINQAWNMVLSGVVDIYVGYQCTLAITSDGKFWCCGARSALYGGSGTNNVWTDCTSIFSGIGGYAEIKDIQLGQSSSLVLTKNGNLYVVGYNNNGELGSGSTSPITTLTLRDTNVTKISLEFTSSWYIKTVNSVGVAYR